MPTTINTIAADANSLYLALANDLDIDLGLPPLVLDTDFSVVEDATLPEVTPLTIAELTQGTVDGTGVFDELMKAVNAHLTAQYDRNRITGADYAKVYLGAVQTVMQFGTQFLLGRDRSRLENLQILETIKLAQAQRTKAAAEVQLVRAQIQNAQFENLALQLKAYTSRNEYASSKMALVLGYNGVLEAEGKQNLINAEYEAKYAEVHDTLPDGSLVGGALSIEIGTKVAQKQLISEQYEQARVQVRDTLSTGEAFAGLALVEKAFKEAQKNLVEEQIDSARATTKDTLLSGAPVAGVTAVEIEVKTAQKQLTEEQYELARSQVRDTLSSGGAFQGMVAIEKDMKLSQKALIDEQVDTARASTKDTNVDGTAIAGVVAAEKNLKVAQKQLVLEQYESQRGQTRGTLSTGETVIGLLGAQTALYQQQIVSYKRDAEAKGLKMILDTWTARKTIDDGVAVPTTIDTPAITTMVTNYRNNLQL